MCKRILAISFIPFLIFLVSAQTTAIDSFKVGNQFRNFILYIPAGINNPSLVINMHGLTSNASQQRAYTGFDRIADREKCIVVYPNGLSNTWDISANQDVNFISQLIDTIDRRYNIDNNRVYATGFSMGGYMSHRLACALSNKIAAIAPVSGLNASLNCSPGRAVPVLQIHGTADPIVLYSGVPQTIRGWVQRNRCETEAQIIMPYPSSNENSAVTKEIYSPCDENTMVELLSIEGATHVWPGASFGGASDINANDEIWAFFKQFSLPGSSESISRVSVQKGTRPGVKYHDGLITIQSKSFLNSVEIIDSQGRLVQKYTNVNKCRNAHTDIQLTTSSGIYLVLIATYDSDYSSLVYVK